MDDNPTNSAFANEQLRRRSLIAAVRQRNAREAVNWLGADPATVSSIFLTTATDVASMGLFLGLATVLIR
jgi:hypothetical protein